MHVLSGSPTQILQQAIILHDRGRLSEAEQLYQAVLTMDGRHFDSLLRFGMLRLDQRRLEDAEHLFRRAVKASKRSADAHQFLGFTLTGLGRLGDALRSYEKAIALRPAFAEAHNNLGYALQALDRLDEAIAHYQKAIALQPDYHEAHNNLGNAFHLQNQSEQAIQRYERAIEIKPDYAEAYWNLGTALRAVGRMEDAIEAYTKAISIRPNYYEAYNSLGNTLRALGRLDEAIAKFEEAVSIKPGYFEALVNHGDTLVALHREEAAMSLFDRALAIRPDDADTLSKRGNALVRLRREEEAMACFDKALAANPDHDFAFDGLARTALATCNWSRAAALWREVPARVAKGCFFDAFSFLGYSSDAELQLACARQFVCHHIPVQPPHLWKGGVWRNDKIRIAYVASGFHQHPTAYLTAELIEIHDRSRFEIVGISLGQDDRSDIRARLIRAFDQFHDVRDKGDRDVAALLNALQIDIAIDRSGHIANGRPGIFAARPAPIQVNYLGYPGTLGASFYDYVIADETVLPLDQQPFYSEKIVHLPDTYQVNDSKRPVSARTPTREEAGLPAEGFVFCCFNNAYKITPPVFDVWMRLLERISGSVLWLYCDRDAAETNLRQEAQRRGIDPARLVFARRVPLEDHLARHRLADLFLDTLPYNAHTTASDALWVGLPVITCRGQSFAGRVAASLLRAMGMPDLVTEDIDAYERLAMRVATEPSVLRELNQRLQQNRNSQPLFDTDRYRRHIEAAYVHMWERWQRGEEAASFTVAPKQNEC
jgi:predicted O-linked N-acetylglucosamine transferase (SPINDLY family)